MKNSIKQGFVQKTVPPSLS